MVEIPLGKGFVALIDDSDWGLASQHTWYLRVNRTTHHERLYAMAYVGTSRQDNRHAYLHQVLMGYPSVDIDHRDNNGLNCQRSNMRLATRSQNNGNSRKSPGRSSRFKGVVWDRERNKWRAQIGRSDKNLKKVTVYIGLFRDEVGAAQAYNFAADELFGEFARLNSPIGSQNGHEK